jgi:hypothetical protein
MNRRVIDVDGEIYSKRIQVLVFFAHGTPSKGIWLEDDNSKYFTEDEAKQINPSVFADSGTDKYNDVHMTAWACQVGNKGDASLSVEENLANSLAQKTADIFEIKVYASATRTDYSETWDGFPFGGMDGDRRTIDNAVWEDDGADDSVISGDSSDGTKMPRGMFIFNPGQTSGYEVVQLD